MSLRFFPFFHTAVIPFFLISISSEKTTSINLCPNEKMGKSSHYVGLTETEVLSSREKYGSNILTPPRKEPLWRQLLIKFKDPLIIILLVAGCLSIGISCYEYYGKNDWKVFFEPIGIFVAIFLATGLAFFFENNANKAFSILNKVNDDELVKVVRNGNVVTIPKKEVVVGDIVMLDTGDEIPADGSLLESYGLHIDESSLTGEPICTKTTIVSEFDKDATYPSNYVLKGTKVMDGHGVFCVEKVGDQTENGKVFVEAQIDNSVKTPLNQQLDKLSRLISNLSYVFGALVIIGRLLHYFGFSHLGAWSIILPIAFFFYLVVVKFKEWNKIQCVLTIIFFIVGFIGFIYLLHNLISPTRPLSELLSLTLNTIMISVSLIVVAVPEGLPMAITLSLAYSMRSMLKSNNLVRKMHACETMGATTVICTDKTGTLTQNRMQVGQSHFFNMGNNSLYREKNDSLVCNSQAGKEEERGERYDNLVYEGMVINSTATLDTSKKDPVVVGNPTEGALLLWLQKQGVDYESLKGKMEKVAEIPFSTERKYMATIARSGGRVVLYVKGAPEIVLKLCSNTVTESRKNEVEQYFLEYQCQAMRTLAFAYKILMDEETFTGEKNNSQRIQKEVDATIVENRIVCDDLVFLGVVGISDPVRPDVPWAVKECLDAGISVKIVSGDTEGTVKEIGRQIGLWKDNDAENNIINGAEIARMSDEDLTRRVDDLKIIARARPLDKKRLVEALQRRGEVVAVTGDGTNDAPALNLAHVGLSMGDGTSVAKEASDITIINNSFSSIGKAVMWGRSLYQNIQRFLLFQLTVNVSACFIVLVGAFFGTKSPLTVTQLLWVNLIMDTFGAMALASLPPSTDVMKEKPRDRNAFILNKLMIRNIVGVGVVFFSIISTVVWICQFAEINSIFDLLNTDVVLNAIRERQSGDITTYEQTLIFSIFVWTHFWYMFNARTFETGKSVFSVPFSVGFKIIAFVIFFGQIVIVELLHNFFNVEPMFLNPHHVNGWIDWLVIVVLSSVVVWVREIWRLFHLLLRKP